MYRIEERRNHKEGETMKQIISVGVIQILLIFLLLLSLFGVTLVFSEVVQRAVQYSIESISGKEAAAAYLPHGQV